MTSRDVIIAHFLQKIGKKWWKSADVIKNVTTLGGVNIIFWKKLLNTFKMSGKPPLYNTRFKSYGFFKMTHNFSKKVLTSPLQSVSTKVKTLTEKVAFTAVNISAHFFFLFLLFFFMELAVK